jgi:hypothetical protein
LKINLSCILLENTNAVVKQVEECVSLAFLEFKLFHFSQQNALHSAPNYNIEITQYKHTIPIATSSSKASNGKGLVQHFRFSYDSVVREIWQKT